MTDIPTSTPADAAMSTDYLKLAKCAGLLLVVLGFFALGVYLHKKANDERRKRAGQRTETEDAAEEERRCRGG